MDTDSDWTNTGLFSPSKAKAHQAQAKDWASVDSWLTKKSATRRLPTFERNEETLQALLSIATLNDAAEEQRNAVERVEKAALSALTKRTGTSSEGLHEIMLDHLETKSDLDTLAELSVLLSSSRPCALDVGTAIVELNDTCFTCDQQLHRTEAQLQALKTEQKRIRNILTTIEDHALQPPPGVAEQIIEWTRSSKHLRAKVAEYDDRLASARLESKSSVTFDNIAKQLEDVEGQDVQVQALESELEAFQSLPSDAKGARSKLEAAREDLRELTRQRDALFEKLASG